MYRIEKHISRIHLMRFKRILSKGNLPFIFRKNFGKSDRIKGNIQWILK